MNESTMFDTHRYITNLTTVGMPEAQAMVLAEEQTRLLENNLTTKADLIQLATKVDLIQVRYDVVKWATGIAFAQTALILGVLPWLLKGI